MEIHVFSTLIHIAIFSAMHFTVWLLYRHAYRPNYKWYMRGNICHRERIFWSAVISIIAFCLIGATYHGLLIFKWI